MARVRVKRASIYMMLAVGWEKSRIKKEGKISERTYFRVACEFQRLSEEERHRILLEAQEELTERVFDKKAWFDRKTCKSRIEIIQRWYDVMTLRNVNRKLKLNRLATFRNLCLMWKIHPKDFTEEHGIRIISAIKNTEKGDYTTRLTIRNFLLYGKGIVPTVISGQKEGYGCMAKEYLTDSEVERIFRVIESLPENERVPLKACLMFMLHSATRINATLRLTEKDLIREGSEVWQIHVVDKGREGKKEKIKVLVSILREALNQYLAWRKKNGIDHRRLFHFSHDNIWEDYKELKGKLKQIYALAVPNRTIYQPCHIWRHTFAMHYLRKTGWNYDLVALLGGWEDTKILKDCYGKPETKDIIAFIEKLERGESFDKTVCSMV